MPKYQKADNNLIKLTVDHFCYIIQQSWTGLPNLMMGRFLSLIPFLTNSSSQVFQKCSVKEVGLKGLVEPQIRELRPGVLLPLKDKKVKDMMSFSRPSNCLPVPAACPWWLSFTMLVWLSYPLLTSSVHSWDGYLPPKMFSLFFKFKFCSFPFISTELMTCADCSDVVWAKGGNRYDWLCVLWVIQSIN